MDSQNILENAHNISLTPSATEGHSKLCDIWPTVREGLELLKSLLKNPVLQAIIGSIIAAGDAITKRICN